MVNAGAENVVTVPAGAEVVARAVTVPVGPEVVEEVEEGLLLNEVLVADETVLLLLMLLLLLIAKMFALLLTEDAIAWLRVQL